VPLARRWTDEDVRNAVAASTSWRQVSTALGLSHGGQSYKKVQEAAQRLGLDLSHFTGQGWSKGTGSGRDPQAQRDAKKRWYDNHPEVYRDRNVRRRAERVALVRERKSRPCADCGRRFPYFIMEFDHRDGATKEFNIANAVAAMVGRKRLLAEMDKCDVVCCVCHRLRSARRAGWTEDADLSAGKWSFLNGLAEDT
jgi:hypothetical protein